MKAGIRRRVAKRHRPLKAEALLVGPQTPFPESEGLPSDNCASCLNVRDFALAGFANSHGHVCADGGPDR
jgi:hypothetical protein